MSTTERELPHQLQRVAELVQTLEACPAPAAREGARELVRALLDLHAAGLARVLDLASQTGQDLLARLVQDELVNSLLVLHGLHPVPFAERVAGALDRLRPRLRAWRGDVELLEAAGEAVRVRLRGASSSGPTLRAAVEAAILEAAPDVQTLILEEAWEGVTDGRVALPLLSNGQA